MRPLHIVILAAGKGTRMKSDRSKVLHRMAGRTLIDHVLDVTAPLEPASVTVIIGHQAENVKHALSARACQFVLQEPQIGTGHALLQAEATLAGAEGDVLLLSGDVPLLQSETIAGLLEAHRQAGAAATVLTADVDPPDGYGRIVRDASGRMTRIVEHRDATDEERKIREINSGIYVFDLAPTGGPGGLFAALRRIGSSNAQGEYYLPDLIALYTAQGLTVATMTLPNGDEIKGVNSRIELAALSRDMRLRKCDDLMRAGVTIEDPATTYIDATVEVAPDTTIHPNVSLQGHTRIGARCEIHSGSRLSNATVADDVLIRDYSIVLDSSIDANATIGPFAHIRPGSSVGPDAHVGNFVELKKTSMGPGAKANHLAYLGDATIGARVNVGAGTITCNYDGVDKHQTVIEDGAFIGSDTQLVAPVRIGSGAYVAAGSSIVEDVPAGALAVTRGRQINKEGWAAKKKASQKRGQ
ncbi:MAG: bifunctional UDP-N-acetylglucosamine diphosphorylase/glucosamine-1-phosphate N-acetyltransferase GlmU [Acidobacteria bacterium]|nr:bifunctional UDP-N-acetylglucosamine diphosphorylase/glucosamine-1-phosphate N-acetyltransferase GlmU [Acidobacteriota bacterium]